MSEGVGQGQQGVDHRRRQGVSPFLLSLRDHVLSCPVSMSKDSIVFGDLFLFAYFPCFCLPQETNRALSYVTARYIDDSELEGTRDPHLAMHGSFSCMVRGAQWKGVRSEEWLGRR